MPFPLSPLDTGRCSVRFDNFNDAVDLPPLSKLTGANPPANRGYFPRETFRGSNLTHMPTCKHGMRPDLSAQQKRRHLAHLLCEVLGGIHKIDISAKIFPIGPGIVIWTGLLQVVITTITAIEIRESNL